MGQRRALRAPMPARWVGVLLTHDEAARAQGGGIE
eukprot:gene33391-40881_t